LWWAILAGVGELAGPVFAGLQGDDKARADI
jgi:hypothetical protein